MSQFLFVKYGKDVMVLQYLGGSLISLQSPQVTKCETHDTVMRHLRLPPWRHSTANPFVTTTMYWLITETSVSEQFAKGRTWQRTGWGVGTETGISRSHVRCSVHNNVRPHVCKNGD